MRGRMLSSIQSFVGVEMLESENGYTFHLSKDPKRFLVSVASWLPVVVVLGLASLTFLSSVSKYPYYSPFTNIEEVALFYTSAGNFIKYGFSASTLLPDYSTSSNTADHPYAYNHMPPGPDIFIALVLKASGENYRLTRLVLWLIFLVGMICYFRFAKGILARFNLAGAGLAVLFLNPLMLLRAMDDPLYATFPLFAFLPLLALEAHYRTGSRWYAYLVYVLAFLGSVYLDYLSLFVVICCWLLLYFTRLVRLERKHLLGFLAAVAVGVLLHLFQNFLYLGPSLFAQELRMTLTNRILGVPSKETMKAFYRSIGMVHHGSTPLNPLGFLYSVWAGLSFPGRAAVILAELLTLAWIVLRCARFDREGGSVTLPRGEATAALGYFGLLSAWIAGTVTLPMFGFPAFTQEYSLHGAGLSAYFLAIGATAVCLEAIRQAVLHRPRGFLQVRAHFASSATALVLVLLAGTALWSAIQLNVMSFRLALSQFTATVAFAPRAPDGVAVSRLGPTTLELSWMDVTGETEYRVEMKGGFRTSFAQIGKIGANITSARINDLAPNATYSLRVRACYQENCSPYSREASNLPVAGAAPAESVARTSSDNRTTMVAPPFKYAKLEDIARHFRGEVYMTNINPVTVGFFAEEIGHGVCGAPSLPESGDIDVTKCHSLYARRQDHYRGVRPKYFFFFPRDLFPGFAECLPSDLLPALQRGGDECVSIMRKRLTERFRKVYVNDLFEVFDLHSAKP